MTPFRIIVYLRKHLDSDIYERTLHISIRYRDRCVILFSPKRYVKGKKRMNWHFLNLINFLKEGFKNVHGITYGSLFNFSGVSDINMLDFRGGDKITLLYDIKPETADEFRDIVREIWTIICFSPVKGLEVNNLLNSISILDKLAMDKG